MHSETIKKIVNESVTIFIVCVSFLIAAAAIRFGFIPLWQNAAQKRAQLETYNSFISSKDGFKKLEAEILSRNNQLRERLKGISGAKEISNFSELLELLIRKGQPDGIKFVKIVPQADIRQQDYTEYPVLLELKTNYHALGRFINSIEMFPNIFKVERIGMDVKEGTLDVKLLVTCLIPNQDVK